jgi:hypothetical protein
MVATSTVSLGDRLTLVDGTEAAVTRITTYTEKGVYAPFTRSGHVVVDRVVASAYALDRLDESHYVIGGVKVIPMHLLAHLFQARHRLACSFNFDYFCAGETYVNGMSAWLEPAYRFSEWLLDHNVVISVIGVIPMFALAWRHR